MSHHFDSLTAIQDGRLNLCDAAAMVAAFLPDVRYRPGQPARFAAPGGPGRPEQATRGRRQIRANTIGVCA